MSAGSSGLALATSPDSALLGLAAMALGIVAAYVALALADPQPTHDPALRWRARLGGALLLSLALTGASWCSLLALETDSPWLAWRWDAFALLFVGCLAALTGLQQRERGITFHALASLPAGIGVIASHQLLMQELGAAALSRLHGSQGVVAWILLLVADAFAFVLASQFRRRRSGSPGFALVAASFLFGLGLWAHHGSLLDALALRSGTSGSAAGGATLALLVLLGVVLLVAAVFVGARRRELADRGGDGSMRRGSRVDAVTGLPSLEVLSESFLRVLRLAVAGHGEVALAVLHFATLERIQSTQGQAERDRLFALAAWRIRSLRRDEELIGVLGDNRLVVVLRVADANDAALRVRELIHLFELPLTDGNTPVRLRPAAGVSLWPAHGDDFSRLLANALVALERCPAGGMQLFHATQREENEQRLRVESTLSSAIADGELGLVLQPIIDALSGEVRVVELLARWNHSELGNIEPRQFILIAESSGVIGEFDRWLLRESISTTKWLDAAGFTDIRVSLNCSPVNLVEPAFIDYFEHTVLDSGIDPARLEVEVTEAALAEGEQLVIGALLRLRALGVGLTIDDFGIGHSSLARLRDLPVDTLKIDQSFVRDMDHPQGEFLVSGILGLAHGLGLAVIAEGVETLPQRRALSDLGCEYLQGFQVSRPLSWRGLLDFLGAGRDEIHEPMPEHLSGHA